MDWYSAIKDFVGPVATIIASVTAATIAFRISKSQVAIADLQARTANDKLVLDLFERRIQIYENVRRVIAKIMTSGKVPESSSFDFIVAIDRSRFLFDEAVNAYLNTLYEAMLDLEVLEKEADSPGLAEEERSEKLKARRRCREQLNAFYKDAPSIFEPFLSAHQRFSPRKAADVRNGG